jgi:arylsulfatase A-like enzyme
MKTDYKKWMTGKAGLLSAFILSVPAVGSLTLSCSRSGNQTKPNILFIAVDDLKPNIGAYGDPTAVTPALNRLAKEGSTFRNCYVQQAISAASRASLLTGMRPDKTKVWDLRTDFRQVNPNALSLPEHFRNNGYQTVAMGKIFHVASAGTGHDAPSWSVPYLTVKATQYANAEKGSKPATECADVPDETYLGGKLAEEGIKALQNLSKSGQPFFLAVGFIKPHLPFVSPKKYWDLYDRKQFKIAPFQEKAHNSPDIAYHVSGELKGYSDIPKFDSYSENASDRLPEDKQLELLHGYYAAVSYTDAQIGKLLDELDRLGLADNTIVVVWGDHGWHLGDHGLWNKHTDFEQATHVPLLLKAPGKPKDAQPATQCEFVDIFPTLCDLAKIPVPGHIDGVSLVPALDESSAEVREYALSQYPRPNGVMGYTIRTKRFRYTEWIGENYTAEFPYQPEKTVARELYDYEKDPLETKNFIGDGGYKEEQEHLEKLFREAIEREHAQYQAYAKLADYQKRIPTSK